MAITKAELFDASQKRLAEMAKALSHPARIAILNILMQSQKCICGDITDKLPLAQSTVSQHLKVLKTTGIIKGEIDGSSTCYCLNEEGIRELYGLINPFIKTLTDSKQGRCC